MRWYDSRRSGAWTPARRRSRGLPNAAGLYMTSLASSMPLDNDCRVPLGPRGSRHPPDRGQATSAVVPCPRRDAGAVRPGQGVVGQHLPDRGQAANGRWRRSRGYQRRPVPTSRRRGEPSRGRQWPSPAGYWPAASPPCPRRDAGDVVWVAWAITCRMASCIIAPRPRRDAGAFPVGQHPPDRRRAADAAHRPRAHVATPGRCNPW
jgi:hypothetical protein